MFKAICTFDQITPRFLSIIFGLGRKIKSTDEDYMACYHQFSIGTETEKVEVKYEDEGNDQSESRQAQAESYGKHIF
jgi:hypothetical protein